MRPTGSIEVAKARLTDLPTRRRAPLAAGIHTSLALASNRLLGHVGDDTE